MRYEVRIHTPGEAENRLVMETDDWERAEDCFCDVSARPNALIELRERMDGGGTFTVLERMEPLHTTRGAP